MKGQSVKSNLSRSAFCMNLNECHDGQGPWVAPSSSRLDTCMHATRQINIAGLQRLFLEETTLGVRDEVKHNMSTLKNDHDTSH